MLNYDIAEDWEDLSPDKKAQVINLASDEQLRRWASDPYCNQKFDCAVALAKHELSNQHTELSEDTRHIAEQIARNRTEVSADARHIVKHLWIIFVLLPVVL